MPAFDDKFWLLGKGGSTPNRGRLIKAEKSPRQRGRTPLKTPSPDKRKRSQDHLVDNSPSKKVRRDDGFQPGDEVNPIDLTKDDDPVKWPGSMFGSANGSKGLIKDTTSVDLTGDSSVNTVATPLPGADPAPRDVKPSITPTPKRGAEKKPEIISLTDSDDEPEKKATAAPSTPVRKTAQSASVEKNFGLVTPGTPKTPRPMAQPKRRLGPIDGQARPDGSSPGQSAIPLTPAHERLGLIAELPFPHDGLTAESPGASKGLGSPFKASPAREDTKEMVLAIRSLPVVREREAVPEREADQAQLRRGPESVSRVVVQNRDQCIVLLKARPHELLRRFGRGIPQRVQRPEIPIDGECFLFRLSPEIQNNIFKHLLLAADPIQLLHQWSELLRGQTLGLYPAILRTCKALYFNCRQFLYGENVFQYLVRDQPRQVAPRSSSRRMYVDKYMEHFRKVELSIERFRVAHAYYTSMVNALQLLIEHGTDLHTLTIDVSPTVDGDTLSTVGHFYKNGEIVQALKTLHPKYIIIRVFTPKTEDEEPTSLRRELDLRIERDPFDKKPVDQDRVKLQQAKLDDLCEMMTRACESPSKVVEQGLFEKFKMAPRQGDRLAKRPSTAIYSFSDDEDDEYEFESNNRDDNDGDYEER